MPPWPAEGLEVTCQIEDLAVGLGMTTFIGPVRSVDGQHEVRCRAAGMWAEGVLHWHKSKTVVSVGRQKVCRSKRLSPGPGIGHLHKGLRAMSSAALGSCHL